MKGLGILNACLVACLTKSAISAPRSTNTSSTAIDSGDGLDNTPDLRASNSNIPPDILANTTNLNASNLTLPHVPEWGYPKGTNLALRFYDVEYVTLEQQWQASVIFTQILQWVRQHADRKVNYRRWGVGGPFVVSIAPYLPGSLTWGEVVSTVIEVQVYLATYHCDDNVIYRNDEVKRRIGYVLLSGPKTDGASPYVSS